MKRKVFILVTFVCTTLCLLSCALKKTNNNQLAKSPKIDQTLNYLAENLDQATFDPIRVGWTFDYGFDDGWLLNKYEYIRSLVTYKDFQAKLKYPIYISGPHTSDTLNLNAKYSFGHYNPKFVSQLRKSAAQIMKKKGFVANTKPVLEKYKILEFLKKHKDIYNITQEHSDEFDSIKSNFIKGIQDKTLPEKAYGTMIPPMLNDSNYWNWSETSYHFWIRRDIDQTKAIWIGLITDVLNAYDS